MEIEGEEFIINIFGNGKYAYFTEEHYNYFKNYTLKFIEKINSNSNYNKKFKFIYEDSISINGNAFSDDYLDRIIISRGIIEKSYSFFYNFLTAFPDLINFKKDNPNLGIKYKISEGLGCVEYDVNIHIPKDKKQCIDAELMSMVAVTFCIFHEIGHIYNGHVGYLNEIKKNSSDLSDLERLTIEMDADAFAISRIIDEILLKKITDGSNDIYKLVQIISYGLMGLILLIYDENGDLELFDKKQLALGYRLGNALECIEANIDRIGLSFFLDKSKLREKIYSSYKVGKFYSMLYGKTIEEFVSLINKGSKDIEGDIKSTWKKLRNNLSKYSIFELAP